MIETAIIAAIWLPLAVLARIAKIASFDPAPWAAPLAGITCAVLGVTLY